MSFDKSVLELIDYSEQGILSKEVFKDNKTDCTLFCMASGTEMSEHTSTKQGFVYVIEGKGVFNLQGKEIEMEQGVLIHMGANAVHSLKAVEDTSFLLILFES